MLLETIVFCIWLETARLVVVAFWGRNTVLAWLGHFWRASLCEDSDAGAVSVVVTVLASLLSSLTPGVGLIVEFFGSFDFDLSPKFQTVGPRRFVKGSGLRVLEKD